MSRTRESYHWMLRTELCVTGAILPVLAGPVGCCLEFLERVRVHPLCGALAAHHRVLPLEEEPALRGEGLYGTAIRNRVRVWVSRVLRDLGGHLDLGTRWPLLPVLVLA